MRESIRYIIAAILVIVGIIVLFRVVTNRGNTADTSQQTQPATVLPDYAGTDAIVSMTIDGRIIGEEEHRAVRVTISRTNRRIEIIQGYSGKVIETRSYANTQEAYNIFLRALEKAGFTKTRDLDDKDERGVCPNGTRTIYELTDGTRQVIRSWTTSCGSKLGTYNGSISLTQTLFREQIPDYNKLVGSVDL